ncbi:Ig-like domain-containing protein [Microvirga sp. TS319]|uniref:Ig-like domain-containing protein n=1 Tax=Microvirga sp. TS319 TaxID=3241165 RepID=UPI00351A2DA7
MPTAPDTVTGTVHTYAVNTWAQSEVVAGDDGKFYVCYRSDGSTGVTVAQWNGSAFVPYASFTTAQAGTGTVGNDIDITIDTQGKVHVAFTAPGASNPNGTLRYATFDGIAWSFSTLGTVSSNFQSIEDPYMVVDSSGQVHVAYRFYDAGPSNRPTAIKYVSGTPGAWTTEQVTASTGTTDEVKDPWIGLGPDGTVNVAFVKEDGQNVVVGNYHLSTKTGSSGWSAPVMLIDDNSNQAGPGATQGVLYSPTIDADGKIHVMYTTFAYDNTTYDTLWTDVFHVSGTYGSGFSTETLVSGGWNDQYMAHSYQVVDGTEYVLIQRYAADWSYSEGAVYYRVEGGDWKEGNSFVLSGVFSYPYQEITMAVGSDGKVMIVTEDTDIRDIKYVIGDAGVVFDNGPPPAPELPDLFQADDSGSSNSDNITANAMPAFGGFGALPGATVNLYADGVLIGTATANAAGIWTTNPFARLSEGDHVITARVVDKAGVESADSPPLKVTIDYTAPSAPSVPDLTTASDTGLSGADNITGDTTPTFTGTADAGETVRLYADGIQVGSTTADASGNWTITANTLDQGTYTITARAVDTAGNASWDSQGLRVTIDTAAPVLDANGSGAGMTSSTTHTEDGGAVRITTSDATLTDAGTISGLTLVMAAAPDGSLERIAYNPAFNGGASLMSLGLTGSYDPATHTFTISGTASAAVYQSVMRAMVYDNDSQAPVTVARTITISATDSQGAVGQSTATINIVSVNDAPVMSPGTVTLTGTDEDTASTPTLAKTIAQTLGVTDVDGTTSFGIAVTGFTGNGTWEYSTDGNFWTSFESVSESMALLLSANTLVRYVPDGERGETPEMFFRAYDGTGPLPSANGSRYYIDVRVANSVSASTGKATLDVTDINDNPYASMAPGVSVDEDGTIALTSIILDDPDAGTGIYTLALTTHAGSLTAKAYPGITVHTADGVNLVLKGTIADLKAFVAAGGIHLTPKANFSGDLTLSITFNDDNGGVGGQSVQITVRSVADAPEVTDATTAEDTQSDSGLVISRSMFDGMNVQYVKITGIMGGTLYLNDGATSVAEGSFISIAEAEKGLKFTPAPDFNGTAHFDAQASLDEHGTGLSGKVTANVTVTPVNDAPIAWAPPSIDVLEDAPTALTGISFSDIDAGPGMVIVTFSVSAGTLAATSGSGVTVGGTPSTLTLTGTLADINAFIAANGVTYVTAPNDVAQRVLTVTINDGDNTGAGGALSDTRTVDLSIIPVNDAPVVTVPSSVSADEDVMTALTGISISDADAGSAPVTVLVSVLSGTLSAISGSGVTVGGTASALTLTGSIADINAFIAASNLRFLGALDTYGTVKVTVTVDDRGNTGVDGAKTDTAEFDIVIAPVNDDPVAFPDSGPAMYEKGTVSAGAANGVLANDHDPDGDVLTVTGIHANGGGIGTVGIPLAGSFGTLTINADGGYTYVADRADFLGAGDYAHDYFTYTASDGNGGTTTQLLYFRIDGVNDVAVFTGSDAGTVTEDGTLVASGILTVSDADNGQSAFQAQADVHGTYGTFSFNHLTGTWTYTLDNDSDAVQALNAGETRQETFKVKSLDGTEKTVTVTVNGTYDPEIIDGTSVSRFVTDNGDGTSTQRVIIPVVSPSRVEQVGDPLRADIPVLTDGSGNVLLGVRVPVFTDLEVKGLTTTKTAANSVADLVREIEARTRAGSLDQTQMRNGGMSFLGTLPSGREVLVQTVVVNAFGAVGLPIVITGSQAFGKSTALVVDARNVPAGTEIQFEDIAFAAIVGNAKVTTGHGNDVIYGDAGAQTIELGGGNDTVYGGGGNDTIFGGDGNDYIVGGEGIDYMDGGMGNDIYFVDNPLDVVVELPGGGTDTVYTSVDFTLGNNLENLYLMGNAVRGRGNDLSNTMTAETTVGTDLKGFGGNDRMYGGAGNDTIDGGDGDDRIEGRGGNDVIYGGDGIDEIKGGDGNDYIRGDAGNDRLYGDAGNDTILGGAGNDVIYGGAGNDVLNGGDGYDTFVFDTALGANNVDTIEDFNPAFDTIQLSKAVFTAFTKVGPLAAGSFVIGTKALDADDRIIYDSSAGALYYDADGNGAGQAVKFANIGKGLALTYLDFQIV